MDYLTLLNTMKFSYLDTTEKIVIIENNRFNNGKKYICCCNTVLK